MTNQEYLNTATNEEFAKENGKTEANIKWGNNDRAVFKHGEKGGMVMSKYSTKEDAIKAYKDLERFLAILSEQSLYTIMRELAPYREKCAKQEQREYDELAKKYSVEVEE